MAGAANRKQRRSRKPGKPLSPGEVHKRKAELRGVDKRGRRSQPYIYPTDQHGRRVSGPPEARTFAGSEYWIDQQFPSRTVQDASGAEVVIQVYFPAAVPAGQIRCRGCGRQTPPQLVTSSGHCDDCKVVKQCEREEEIGMGGESPLAGLVEHRGGRWEKYGG